MASSLTPCLDRGVWTRTMCLQRAANTPACLCWQLLPLVFLWIEVCMKKKKSLDCAAKPLVVPISKQVRRVISVADRRACFNRIRRLSLIALISVKLPEWQLNRCPCWGTFVEAVELECKEVSWILRFHLIIFFYFKPTNRMRGHQFSQELQTNYLSAG